MAVGLAPGDVVAGRFKVERTLGEGGMGAVYLAVQEPLGRKVALKIMRRRNEDAEMLMRFLNEARSVAHLNCPHVVALYDYGEHAGAPYIAMELLDGETLRERLQRGRAPVAEVLSWARDIACGLRIAHESGIVHRDLKPENVMLVPDRDRGVIAKLLDFGIAKHSGAAEQLTPGDSVFGTPGYISPEVAIGGKADDPRGDVYAFGVCLYEALCNAPPYAGASSIATMMAHVNEPVPDPRDGRGDIPHPVAALVMRALAKDPALRPANGAALVEEIDKLRAGMDLTQSVTPLATPLSSTPAAGVVGGPRGSPSTGLSPIVDRPSIAVQPFIALGSSNDEDVLFAEGISEDILTATSCFKQLFVVAQSTMWQKGGRETDALRVGQNLGVRYVVGGSVRRSSGRVRINASLVDINTGMQIWGQRYDRSVDDLFAVQDEVTQAIVACVAGHIEKDQADGAKRKAPHALAAWDWLARGRALHHRRTLEDNVRAREALDKAVAIDPEYAQAHAWRACVLGQANAMTGEEHYVDECRKAAALALSLDGSDAECHRLAAEIGIRDSNLDKAEHHHARAISLNPNDARIVAQRGEISLLEGDFERAATALEQAIRLDSLNPQPYMRHLACVRYMERKLADALTLARHLADERTEMLALACAVASLRNDPDLESLTSALAVRRPGFKISSWHRPFRDARLASLWREGFERAGLA